MALLVPKGSTEGTPQLEVADDQVEFWTERGYVQVGGSAAKKTTAKKASPSKSKK